MKEGAYNRMAEFLCIFSAEPEMGMQDVNPPRPKAIGPAEALGVRVDLSGQAS